MSTKPLPRRPLLGSAARTAPAAASLGALPRGDIAHPDGFHLGSSIRVGSGDGQLVEGAFGMDVDYAMLVKDY